MWTWESSLTDIRHVFGGGGGMSSMRGGSMSGTTSSRVEKRHFPTLTVAAGSTIVGAAGTLEAYHQRQLAEERGGAAVDAKSAAKILQKHLMVLGERSVAETLMRFVLAYTQTRAFVRDFFEVRRSPNHAGAPSRGSRTPRSSFADQPGASSRRQHHDFSTDPNSCLLYTSPSPRDRG